MLNMNQAIPIYVINLDRRPDRLQRIEAHLHLRGVVFERLRACDATLDPKTEIDRVIAPSGPLGPLGLGDRACTVSHTRAWARFLFDGYSHGLFLEDDIHLGRDLAEVLSSTAWIPDTMHAVKLEKFNRGASRVLLGRQVGQTPSGRALHPMRSRHVGGGAYILSRQGAMIASDHIGRLRVPVDHFLFNDTVSPVRTDLAPGMLVPPMATQKAYTGYDSDIAPQGRKLAPPSVAATLGRLRRGTTELSHLPRQLVQLLLGQARMATVEYSEAPPGAGPEGTRPRRRRDLTRE